MRDRGAWDDAFVDALCEPPEAFTYGGVISHVLAYGAIRREALAGVLRELGADCLRRPDRVGTRQLVRIAQVPPAAADKGSTSRLAIEAARLR